MHVIKNMFKASKCSCNIVCKCFVNDNNVQNIVVERGNQICSQKYYKNPKQLLAKHLCDCWHSTYLPRKASVSIAIIGAESEAKDNISSCFDGELPALKRENDKQQQRTMFVDNYQFNVKLANISSTDVIQANIYMILLTNHTSAEYVHSALTKVWEINRLVHVIFVGATSFNSSQCKSTIMKISKTSAIPYISINDSNQRRITNLFKFAIKYYWFCTSQQMVIV